MYPHRNVHYTAIVWIFPKKWPTSLAMQCYKWLFRNTEFVSQTQTNDDLFVWLRLLYSSFIQFKQILSQIYSPPTAGFFDWF